jgi:hypothetical protein
MTKLGVGQQAKFLRTGTICSARESEPIFTTCITKYTLSYEIEKNVGGSALFDTAVPQTTGPTVTLYTSPFIWSSSDPKTIMSFSIYYYDCDQHCFWQRSSDEPILLLLFYDHNSPKLKLLFYIQ